MQFLRLFSRAALAGALVSAASAASSCSNGNANTFDNGRFTAPSQVTVGQPFTATYVANTPSVYPNVQVVPVSTAYIALATDKPGFVAVQPGQAWMYAVSGSQLLDYQMITIVGASQ